MPKSTIRKLISKKKSYFIFAKLLTIFLCGGTRKFKESVVLEKMKKLSLILQGGRPKKSPKSIFQFLKSFSKKSFCYLYLIVPPHQNPLSLKESAALEVY